MRKMAWLILGCCMLAGLMACSSIPATTTATVATENTTEVVETSDIAETVTNDEMVEVTLEMLELSEHCKDVDEHCNYMECDRDCTLHCDEHCIWHVPDYLGLPVTAPQGYLLVVSRVSPDERDQIGLWDLSKVTIMEVDADKRFEVAGIQYVTDIQCHQDPERENDGPLTYEESSDLCVAIPVSVYRTGLVYLRENDNEDFILVLPATIEKVKNWWE